MANGFFLGGMAEGIAGAQKQDLAERTLGAETALRTRGLDLTEQGQRNDLAINTRKLDMAEKAQRRAEAQAGVARVDKQITDTMSIVAEIVKEGRLVGKTPDELRGAVLPLLDSAKQLAGRVGRNPAALDAQVSALLTSPTALDRASAAGTAEGTQAIAKAKAMDAAGMDTLGAWKTLDEKVKAEGALRDDYLKQSTDFIKIRDAKSRIDNIEDTGAGDMALVFQYMKILDPGSTVREGEYATAAQAAGVPSTIIAQYNKLVGGGQLAPEARSQIKSQAGKLYQAQAGNHDRLTTQFANIAKRNRLNVDNVIVDLSPAAAAQSAPAGKKGSDLPPPPKGFEIVP